MTKDSLIPVGDPNGQPVPGLYRSEQTGTIIAKKNAEYHKYMKDREQALKMKAIEEEVALVKDDIQSIKQMLTTLLANSNGNN